MLVGELKAALEDVPDDALVIAMAPGDPSVGIMDGTFDVENVVFSLITAEDKYLMIGLVV